MTRKVVVTPHTWILREPFVISRGSITSVDVVVVRVEDSGHSGRGEARGVPYHGETSDSMLAQIEGIRRHLERGAQRHDLLQMLPAGGARNAVDCALWDLEAKQTGVPAWKLAGVGRPRSLVTTVTIGMRSLEAYEARARALADHPWLKIKVGCDSPLEAIAAVRRGAPRSRLVVDANQAWSMGLLQGLAPGLVELGVTLLEQPTSASEDGPSRDLGLSIPICADEPADTVADLPKLVGRYDFVNIKLDKAGGLTAALELARAAREQRMGLMVGCMTGSSLAMAPAMIVAQMCDVVDLDGPLLIDGDWADGITYQNGSMSPALPQLWG
jgi:L-alanine-DL-glutamate epimerase-like enolase superfamily enzyme